MATINNKNINCDAISTKKTALGESRAMNDFSQLISDLLETQLLLGSPNLIPAELVTRLES